MPALKKSLCLFALALAQLIDSSPVCPTNTLRAGEATWFALESECAEERRSCELHHGISIKNNVLNEECWFRPIDEEQQFFGPCPETLRNSESLFDIDTVDWTLAQVLLRQYFRASDRVTFYKASESASELQRILEMDPDNNRAIEISLRYADQFKISADRRLQLALRLRASDPACIGGLWFYIGTLGYIIDLIANEAEVSRGISLPELAASDIKIREAIELVESAYLDAHESIHPYKKLPLSWAFVSEPFFGRVLSRLGDETLNKHRLFVTNDLRLEFGADVEADRKMSLNMLCNDYAFELGLMNSCVDLVARHWESDVALFDKPSDDVIEATTRLALASSRRCDEPSFLDLPQDGFRVVTPSTRCVPEIHAEANVEINRLLDQLENLKDYPEISVLRAYTNPVSDSRQIFMNVIADDSKQVVHAILIAKRLNKVGAVADAELVLAEALNTLDEDYDESFFECWFPRIDRFWSRSFEGIANYLSLQGHERISNVRKLVKAALDVQIGQGGESFLEGAYISDPPTNWSDSNYCDTSLESPGIAP